MVRTRRGIIRGISRGSRKSIPVKQTPKKITIERKQSARKAIIRRRKLSTQPITKKIPAPPPRIAGSPTKQKTIQRIRSRPKPRRETQQTFEAPKPQKRSAFITNISDLFDRIDPVSPELVRKFEQVPPAQRTQSPLGIVFGQVPPAQRTQPPPQRELSPFIITDIGDFFSIRRRKDG